MSALMIRIAIVRDREGHATVCGPNDFRPSEDRDAMEAAMRWSLEAGHVPIALAWASVTLPPLPSVEELRAEAKRGEFPASIIAEWDA